MQALVLSLIHIKTAIGDETEAALAHPQCLFRPTAFFELFFQAAVGDGQLVCSITDLGLQRIVSLAQYLFRAATLGDIDDRGSAGDVISSPRIPERRCAQRNGQECAVFLHEIQLQVMEDPETKRGKTSSNRLALGEAKRS